MAAASADFADIRQEIDWLQARGRGVVIVGALSQLLAHVLRIHALLTCFASLRRHREAGVL